MTTTGPSTAAATGRAAGTETPGTGRRAPTYPPTCWALVEQARDQRPDHVFLTDDHGRSLTGRQLHDAALGVAATLHDRGIGPGSVVSWQLPTTLEAMVVMVALTRLGAVQNPVIPVMREREVRFITDQVGTELLIVPETWRGFDHGGLARTLAGEGGFDVLVADHDTDPRTTGGALRLPFGDPATLPPIVEDPDAVRWLFHSSGTTADPKGIRHTDASVMASATGTIVACGVTDRDVNPLAFPISHIGGIAMLSASLMTGMRCVLFDTFEPDTAIRMAAHRPTMLGSAVPFFLAYFHAQRTHGDEPLFPALRMLVGGGAPVPSEVSRSARELMGVDGIGNAWGLTEFPVATFPDHDAPPEVLDHTAGRVVPGVRIRVVDGDEREVGPGEEGELRLQGPQCFGGYLDPALDAEAFDADGWFRTGDLGFVDADGYVHVTGRLKDIIIRNAENISALEVEEAVMRHPAVVDATVLGLADEAVGERVGAVVVLAEGATLSVEDLARHCRDLGLARHKTPERLEVRDVLPRNPMGKVLKQELRDTWGRGTTLA